METNDAVVVDNGPFEGLDPDIILPLLTLIPAEDCLNGKTFYKTYKKWESLNVIQRTNVVTFWNRNVDVGARNRILDQARAVLALGVSEDRERQAMTNKHDRARILHLRVDPGAAADWTAAFREKTRAELDTNAADADPWNRLAAKFNDYETYKFSNAVILPGELTPAGLPKAVPGMEIMLAYCHDINPSAVDRPIRDGGWLRTQYRELKGKISVCFNNYRRSGNQELENIYDAWVPFAVAFNNDIVVYARAVLSDDDMNRLGRALPIEVQRDTGAIDPENTYERRVQAAQERKRQRRNSRELRERTPVSSPSGSSIGASITVASVLQDGMERANKIAALTALYNIGNEEDRETALKRLRDIAN